jgi:chromate transport protein ChrA
VRKFFRDRLNRAWAASAVVLVAALVFVPNSGAGTIVLIVAAAVVIGLSGAARIRDARRDRNRR